MFRKAVYEYRKHRYELHLDDKILTSWNGLMIAAMCQLYHISEDERYLSAAKNAQTFIDEKLSEKDTLFVSFREGKRSENGFLDDYAFQIYGLIALYEATLDSIYIKKAKQFCDKVVMDFYDEGQGGFFLYGRESEQLIFRPKETYDGAVFSGNSAMAYNFVKLFYLTGEMGFQKMAEKQLLFMEKEAGRYPAGYAMFLVALSDYLTPPEMVCRDGVCQI